MSRWTPKKPDQPNIQTWEHSSQRLGAPSGRAGGLGKAGYMALTVRPLSPALHRGAGAIGTASNSVAGGVAGLRTG